MSFYNRDESGNLVRYAGAVIDCQAAIDDPGNPEVVLVEQAHVKECDINEIVRKHGPALVQRHVQLLQSDAYRFDDVVGNDFQEAMLKVTKAQETFDALPAAVRKEFHNSPAEFLDFVHNPDNADRMVDMGLAQRIPESTPVQVQVVNAPEPNPETPPGESGAG
jgi:phage internal scaffolding protein